MLLGVGEDRIVGLQAILVKESLVTTSRQQQLTMVSRQITARGNAIDLPNTLDIQKWVLKAE